MKKIAFIAVVLALFLISSCSTREDEDTLKARKLIEYQKNKFDSLPLSGKIVNGVREIEVRALQYRWEPESIVVKKGEKIKLTIESDDVQHGFEIEGVQIPGWNVDDPIKKGEKVVLEYTADESGTWDLVCTVYCGPGHVGMRRIYIVKE